MRLIYLTLIIGLIAAGVLLHAAGSKIFCWLFGAAAAYHTINLTLKWKRW